jgi:16S rRNA (cytosine967-C5)-methyltransferase
VLEKGAYSNLAATEARLPAGMDARDRAFASAAVYGTLARIVSIDAVLARFSRMPPAKLQPWIRTLLRFGLWQLLWSRSVPPSAACDTSVALARRFSNSGGAGYVNAVLRSVARAPDASSFPPDDPQAPLAERAASLSVRRSLPSWMARRLIARFGADADPLAEAFLGTPRFTVRTNRLRTTPEALAATLSADGVRSGPGLFQDEALAIALEGHPVARLPAFRSGLLFVQDEAAMLVSHVADPRPGMAVLDACAAPGGKTTHLAERMENRGRIVARDAQEGRLGLICENCARLGCTIVETEARDATVPDGDGPRFDLVLVDVPCSGLGLLAKKPEIRLNMTQERADALPTLQLRILAASAESVLPGGRLVYSTCTVLAEENDQVADAFLRGQGDRFTPEPFDDLLPPRLLALDPDLRAQAGEGRIQLLPHRHGCDGFFIARFRRRSGP